MLATLKTQWFLVSLTVLIASGLFWGMQAPKDFPATLVADLPAALRWIAENYSRTVTAVILFLMAFSLESRKIGAALRSPAPVALAIVVNYGGIPLLGWLLAGTQSSVDFRLGLLIAATVPCTLAGASVWTRKANGNDAVSLMVTLTTNGACFLLTPFWLGLMSGQRIEFDATDMAWRLATAVLVPCILGQCLRVVAPLREWATRHKTAMGVVAQALILTLIFGAAFRGGQTIAGSGSGPGWMAVLWVWLCAVVLHVTAMAVGWGGSQLFGFTRADAAAVVIAGSQKTLPVGLLLATDPAMLGNPDLLGPGIGVPFAVFPMLMYHASQLFIDTAVAARLRSDRNGESTTAAVSEDSTAPPPNAS